MAEFSDRPMPPPPPEDQYWGFFPAKYTSRYLESCVDDHVYNGQSIRDRILFSTPVDGVREEEDGQWVITSQEACLLRAKKLIDATGMTSQPHIPQIPGQETFQGYTIHHKTFGRSTFLKDNAKQNVVVLGGAKSAADVAYASAKAGKSVSWIIRRTGNGPAAFFAPEPISKRYANSNEGFYNRFMASFLPSPFGSKGLLARLLHGTWFGRKYLMNLWNGFDKGLRALMDYGRIEGQEHGFANLEPDTPIFWQNDSSGVSTRPDFLSTIATKVQIYRRDVDRLNSHSVVLAPKDPEDDELTLPADVLVYCTGWDPVSYLFSSEEAERLGLTIPAPESDPKVQSHWQGLETDADRRVLSDFPYLGEPPPYLKLEPTHTPFRLYKAIAPVNGGSNHSIVFLGKMVVGNNFRTAEAQALWAVAYLDGRVDVSESAMQADVAMTVAWNRRRYLNKGQLGSWFYFDVVGYADMLLEQLKLSSHRRKGWFRDLMDPCLADDFRDLAAEYKARYGA
ncbi:MAG: hypothetical protein Q9172_005447 [Xanthocarpia lactea]